VNKSSSNIKWFRRILIFIFLIAVSAISNALFNPQSKSDEANMQSSVDIHIQKFCASGSHAYQWASNSDELLGHKAASWLASFKHDLHFLMRHAVRACVLISSEKQVFECFSDGVLLQYFLLKQQTTSSYL
jgi:hypothetical protein